MIHPMPEPKTGMYQNSRYVVKPVVFYGNFISLGGQIDPNRRHVDKSVVAQFWKLMDAWMALHKQSLLS